MTKAFGFSLAGLFLLVLAVPARAGRIEPLPSAPGHVYEVFGVEDGLPRAGISQALQSRDGYLWLATFDGLARFDGDRFEVFDSENTPALGSNRIFRMLESPDGTLWIRTEQGHVVRHANGAFTACARPREGRADCTLRQAGAAYFTQIFEDSSGGIWAGGPSGLFRYEQGELREIPGLRTESAVEAFLHDREGRLWVGTRTGLWMGRPGRFERVALPPGSLDRGTPVIAEDAAGEIWLGTSVGAGRLRDGRFLPETLGLSHVGKDRRGRLWVSRPDKLWRVREGRLAVVLENPGSAYPPASDAHFATGPGGETWIAWGSTLFRDDVPAMRLPISETITSVAVDREGTAWATTSRSGGLYALHPARIANFAEGLPSPVVYPVYEDRDGAIWTGSGHYADVLAPGAKRFRAIETPVGPNGVVLAFLRDRSGTFWAGTNMGLFTLGPGGFAPAGGEGGERLRSASVRAIHEDSRGVLWVGTDDGLYRREGERWSRLTARDGLPHPWVRVIRETPDGTLWLGTNGGGVVRLQGGRFKAVTQAHGLSSDLVRAIWAAPDGRLWIATENAGLNRLDPATGGPRIDVVRERQGLYRDGIHQIVPDGLGNLWMSTNHGIFRARLRDLDAVADGTLARLETVAYTERDGMGNREANGSVQDAGLGDRAGRIWFPTLQGLVRVDPRAVLGRSAPPPVHVHGLRAGEENLPLTGGTVRVSPHQRNFAVEFTAPSFLAPERQRFRYRLVPYDRDWIDAGPRREAFYTKVPPGRYVFEVLGSGPDGDWNVRPATLSVEVVPRFFETKWFLLTRNLLAIALIVGGVFAAVRLRGAQERARQRALERLVAERTATIAEQAEKLREVDRLKSQFFANVSHEFRTPLTLILGPLRDAREGAFGPLGEELAGQLEVAERNSRRLLGLVDQLLDVARLDAGRLRLRVRRGDLADFTRRRIEAFLPLAERQEIELSLAAPEPVEVWFDDVQLEKVFDNLLGNALKFTPPGGRVQVALTPRPEAGRVEVSIRDDGPGIPADQLEKIFERFYQVEATDRRRWPGAGIGLALAVQLVELHGGSIAVESAEGRGACFTVSLLLGREHLRPELADDETWSGGERVPTPAAMPGTGEVRVVASGARPNLAEEDRTTVLVVDDNAEIRAYVRRHLEPEYRVVEAADGLAGLEMARRVVPDLVVSDLMMPGLDGNALFQSLRGDPELDTVPVVLLTAKASSQSRLQGLREGVDDYLAKPFDPRELRARVDNLIRSRRRLLERISSPRPRPLRVSQVEVTSADEAFLARVQAAVEERLGDPELTVEALADTLRCDRSYLLRKLRALTGETPSSLIRSLRLQRAEQLLGARAGAVSEIAYAVGFKSVAHFSNAFQERYGERPSAFAARHRGP
jgi:signal transduction histidine kinase/ligand-binding sensor domain-containing protein/DNA-binding response OmpR family regulator